MSWLMRQLCIVSRGGARLLRGLAATDLGAKMEQSRYRASSFRNGSRKVMFPAFSWKNRIVGRCRLVARLQPIGCRYQACSFVPSLAVRSTSCAYSNMPSCPRLSAVCSCMQAGGWRS